MDLLNDIRQDLLNESATLENTLRKARVLAHEVQSLELRQWVMSELDGYLGDGSVPDYRRIPLPVSGTFLGPYRRRISNELLSTSGLEEPFKELADVLVVFEGVAEISERLTSADQEFKRPLPPEIVHMLRGKIHMSGGMVLSEAYQRVPRGVLHGVLDTVKNRLLEFILELQGKAVTLESVASGVVEPEEIRNAVSVTIYGNHNVVATGENIQQVIEHVQTGNLDSLLEQLKECKVCDEDLMELADSIAAEPMVSEANFGPKVSGWIGGMLSKAASGIWQVGLKEGSQILTDALKSYYGT